MTILFVFLSSYIYLDFPLPNRATNINPESSDKVPFSSALSIEFVVASLKGDDSSWLAKYIPQWNANIYVANDQTAPLTVSKNKGREANIYLTYVLLALEHHVLLNHQSDPSSSAI